MRRRNTVVLARKSQTIDLEYCMFKIVEGKTYEDDGTTVFDVYLGAGLQDESFERAARRPDTILVRHPEAWRGFLMGELVPKRDLARALDNATFKLTVRLGVMLATGIALLGAILKLA